MGVERGEGGGVRHDYARVFFLHSLFSPSPPVTLFGMFFPLCSLDRPISKRCANLSTCVLGKLSQELHKLQTYPRTDVGAGTPGKKRNVLNELENERYANY